MRRGAASAGGVVTLPCDLYGDSIANSLGDVAAFVLGYMAAMGLPTLASAYPLEAVKRWQLGG